MSGPDHRACEEPVSRRRDHRGREGERVLRKKNRWIVDPLDGTTNYAHGYPFFATSIAYEEAGEVTLGVVYNPIFRELFFARKGGGRF